MKKDKMSFAEIKNNKDAFLENYGLVEEFYKCGYSWDELMLIGEDYDQKRENEYFKIIQNYLAEISKFSDVHSYRYRIKETDSLLAKVIRKAAKREERITVENYYSEITDLLGIRILYIFKEDYWSVNKQLMDKYKKQLAENIHLKLRDGDDEKTYRLLVDSYDISVERNEAYRSIHYTIYSNPIDITNSPKIEIQTRSIFEEGWSEINHKLVYKNDSTLQLKKLSTILSGLVGSCDAVGSLMKYAHDNFQNNTVSKTLDDSSVETDIKINNDSIGNIVRDFLS